MRGWAAPPATGHGGFARWWTEFVAGLADHVPGGVAGLAVLVLLLAGAVTGALYWWPHRHLRPRRARSVEESTPVEPLPDADEDVDAGLPERDPAELRSLADRYAAAGRYAEAVRERLRAMVRELVDRQVLEHQPGWTVTELAHASGVAAPTLSAPMREAADLFSRIWYGRQPATAAHDERMRALADQVDRDTALLLPGVRRATSGPVSVPAPDASPGGTTPGGTTPGGTTPGGTTPGGTTPGGTTPGGTTPGGTTP
ncbi:MAG: DUF4129 domain-containing protein, partial [Actinocatenispora sp.]